MKRLLLIPILLLGFVSHGQVAMTGTGSYTQDFNALLNTGTTNAWVDNTTIPAWYAQRSGTGTTYRADNGSGNTGALYSFGTTSATERALGSLGSANAAAGDFAHGLLFHNTSSGSIGTVTVGYTLEQWRDGGATTVAAQSITFWYKVSSSAITSLNPNVNATWTQVTALTGTSPIFTNTGAGVALDGNLPVNKVSLSNVVIPGLVLAAGEYLMIKWDDPNQAGNDHGLSIDDVNVSWTAVVNCNTTSTINPSVCSTYTTPSGNNTYTTSGTYTDVIPNAAGCDSTITINLIIRQPTTSTINPTACTSYTTPSGANTYTTSGTYTDVIPNAAGCDSTITINLNIVASITYYADADGDGLGNAAVTTSACTPPVGYVTNSNDCDDTNNLIGAATTWYLDSDGDTYGGSASVVACSAPANHVANNTDCNDANAAIHPGATEIPNNGTDEDCSGGDLVILPTALGIYEFTGNDCTGANLNVTAQPANAAFGPYGATAASLTCAAAANVINYSDWNLTADVDLNEYYSFNITPASCYEADMTELHFSHRSSTSGGTPTIHIRSSLDGFAADVATVSIAVPNVLQNDVIMLPAQFLNVTSAVEFRFYITSMSGAGATYRHDNVSLFGTLTALSTSTYYADADGDSFGNPAVSVMNCITPAGYVADNTDCNDNNAAEHPGATWAIDNDNDGFIGATTQTSCTQPVGYISSAAPADCNDNNNAITGQTVYYADTDNDGFGDANNSQSACTPPVGYVTNDNDCDDSDNSVGLPTITYYIDADGDMYGDPNNSFLGCSIQVGYAMNGLDCDDTDSSINPDAAEVCDGVDNNCDGNTDEGFLMVTYFEDADSDGLGNPAVSTTDCTMPAGYVANNDDCDDTDSDPNAGMTFYFEDLDGDTYGNDLVSISACAAPNGYVTDNTDCDDTDEDIHPDAIDTEGNSIDENCDGVDGNLGLSDAKFNALTAYPNPGSESVTIAFNGSMENTEIRFIGVDGKEVNIGLVVSGTNGLVVSTQNLIPGVYFIEVTQNGTQQVVRWVKK